MRAGRKHRPVLRRRQALALLVGLVSALAAAPAAHAEPASVVRAQVDVAARADHPMRYGNAPGRALERGAGSIHQVPGDAHRGVDAKNVFIAARDFHLVVRAWRTHEPHVLQRAARPDQAHRFLRGELPML